MNLLLFFVRLHFISAESEEKNLILFRVKIYGLQRNEEWIKKKLVEGQKLFWHIKDESQPSMPKVSEHKGKNMFFVSRKENSVKHSIGVHYQIIYIFFEYFFKAFLQTFHIDATFNLLALQVCISFGVRLSLCHIERDM